jgi:hypothetical protein
LISEDQDGVEEADGGVVTKPNAIQELTEMRPLLAEQDERLAGLIAIAEHLQELTGWDRDQLLDSIGCGERNPSELAAHPAKIKRCETFLGTLLEAAGSVEGQRSCRGVIKRCARLSKAETVDVEGLAAALSAGKVSGLKYFELGEIASGERAARIAAGVASAAQKIGPSPYDGLPTVHLSRPRIDMYVKGKVGLLGERTAANMTTHIKGCKACEAAVETRRQALLSSN